MRLWILVGLGVLGFFGGKWAATPSPIDPLDANALQTLRNPTTDGSPSDDDADLASDAHGQPAIQMPNADRTPEEVVALQLASLRTTRKNPQALRQCYAFASPKNRTATGPLPRFAAMIAQPPFDALLDQDAWLVGRALVRGNNAILAATVVGSGRKLKTFRFLLTRQSSAPYEGCWMTEGVWPDEPQSPASSSPLPVPSA